MMMAEATLDQKLGTVLRLHEEAFRQLGGVPEEILYDRMKTVWLAVDERGEIIWNPVFLDFARYWGFTPRLCRPYRAQTKGKVESGVKYVRRNFLCGLLGREPGGLEELNAQLRHGCKAWLTSVCMAHARGTRATLAERTRAFTTAGCPSALSVCGRRTAARGTRCLCGLARQSLFGSMGVRG